MVTTAVSSKPVIVLFGTYPPDARESMLQFGALMKKQLAADGYTVEEIAPQSHFGSLGAGKWLGRLDKFGIFPLGLLGQSSHIREKYLGRKIVVHICDQANAVYATLMRRWFPVVVTCHALDDAGYSGAFDQLVWKEVLHGLRRAHFVVCDSPAVQADLVRLAGKEMAQHSEVIPPAPDDPASMMRRYEDVYQRV